VGKEKKVTVQGSKQKNWWHGKACKERHSLTGRDLEGQEEFIEAGKKAVPRERQRNIKGKKKFAHTADFTLCKFGEKEPRAPVGRRDKKVGRSG